LINLGKVLVRIGDTGGEDRFEVRAHAILSIAYCKNIFPAVVGRLTNNYPSVTALVLCYPDLLEFEFVSLIAYRAIQSKQSTPDRRFV